jgi:antitoxin VapB
MALSIKHPEADQLAREVAALTKTSITDAVMTALREKRARLGSKPRQRERDLVAIDETVRRFQSLPVMSQLTDDEILGYDDSGIPTR